ncbi:MAG: hypothetical protein K2G52_06100 [Muribaculaceae bacterium]|nr:hypothetical protein [Muribaculaceae bacterium]
MKKLFLTLIALAATSFAGFAQISLDDAYTSLVNNPGMVEKSINDVQLAPGVTITNLHSVTYKGSRYAQDFIYTYESLPVVNQLIGANNQSEMACAFTEPSDNGVYNVLFLVGEKGGPYVAAYGQTTADGIDAIRNSEVSLEGDELVMAVTPTVDVIEFIGMAVVE